MTNTGLVIFEGDNKRILPMEKSKILRHVGWR